MINHPIESSYGKYAYGVGYNTNSKLIIIQVQDRDEMVEMRFVLNVDETKELIKKLKSACDEVDK